MHQQQFERLLQEIEQEYTQLWDILGQFKTGINNDDIFTFQYRLGNQLRKIQLSYNNISTRETKLIERKNFLNASWFKKTLKNLSEKREGLKSLNYLGRSLGDAFAYFFYQFNVDQLDKHLKHEEISSFPASIGGLGELEFIRNCKLISGHFTVYHGITNILRVGDVSLFNTKTLHLTGIGELKTKKKNERELEISLILIGKGELEPFGKREIKVIQGNIENLADGFHDEARVKRQIRGITKHFAKEHSKASQHSYFDRYHFKDMDQLLKDSKRYRVNFKRVSDGLIYACVKAKRLFNKRFSDETPSVKRNFENFRQSIKELTISDYELNSILYGSILYEKNSKPQIGIGIPPLFWSFLSMDSLKSLYFQECVLVTIFNPAYIFKRLEEKGFTVTTHNNVIIELTRTGKKSTFSVPGMTLKSFFDRISNHGQTEDGVVDMICSFYDKVKNKKLPGATKIELNIRNVYRGKKRKA